MKRSLDQVREALASRYRVERELGSGASATVYLAHDLEHDREVAIKVLNPELVQATGGERFLREIRVAASLQHPNLLRILDSGELGGLVFYVTPHIPGGTLRDLLKRERQLSIRDAVHFTRELASALGYIHSHGIVHRDVKPENILLDGQHACLADFGIARALERVSGETITSTGLVVGTPAYMSPEQGSGERAVDARSDQYSLGCVAYEMIAGMPPFLGATAQAVIAQRFAHSALPLSHYRKSVPPHIETAIARALELNPADRYPSVERLAASLSDATLTSTAETWGVRTSRAVQRRWFAIGAATALVILAVFGFTQAYPRVRAAFGTAPDTTRFVVVPFDATTARGVSGARLADAVYITLREWEGLPVVQESAVRDEVGAQRTSITSLAEASGAAAVLGAGRLIWGRAVPFGGGVTVTADLYDVRARRSLRNASVQISAGESMEQAMGALADELLRLPELRRAPEGELGTRNFVARREFERGEIAYASGDFAVAREHYLRAAAADPEFARADLRIALVGMLMGLPLDEWQQQARRAAAAREMFSQRGSAFAVALAALADRRYADACSSLDTARRVDSLDFAAWYGLGECRFLDSTVVRSSASPSGHVFRSSYHTAAESYRQAVILDERTLELPVFTRLKGIFKTEASGVRAGVLASDAARTFAGFPRMDGDSLGFVPYDRRVGLRGEAYPPSLSHERALEHGATRLLNFAQLWVQRRPRSSEAFEGLAEMLEVGGHGGDRDRAALGAVRRARSLTTDRARSFSLSAREVRLLTKMGHFVNARHLADSLLAEPVLADSARTLYVMAALTGRAAAAVRFRRMIPDAPAGAGRIPPEVGLASAALSAYSVLGVCARIDGARRDLVETIDSYTAGDHISPVRNELLYWPGVWSAPCTRAQSSLWSDLTRIALDMAQLAFAQGAPGRSIAILDSAEMVRRPQMRASDISLDFTYQEAWLRSAAGDTLGAIRQLDRALRSLPAHRVSLTQRAAEAAALPRAMMLRAELADAAGDRETARQWAAAAVALWTNADPELQNLVSRMKQLAAR